MATVSSLVEVMAFGCNTCLLRLQSQGEHPLDRCIGQASVSALACACTLVALNAIEYMDSREKKASQVKTESGTRRKGPSRLLRRARANA